MCVIFVGKRKAIEELNLVRAWAINEDGAGMIIPGKSATAIKGLMTFEDVTRALKSVKGDESIALHFRYATHGKPSQQNTHPFAITRNSFLMHNGILNGLGSAGNGGQSDSAHLARILRHLRPAERAGLLRNLNGRFVVVTNREISTYGSFIKEKGVMCSNLNWISTKKYKMPTAWGNLEKWAKGKQLEVKNVLPKQDSPNYACPTGPRVTGMLPGFESTGLTYELSDDELRAMSDPFYHSTY